MDSTEKPKKRRNSSTKKPMVAKESVTSLVKEESKAVMFITIEEHNEIINEKVSHNISLENGLRANEALTNQLKQQTNDRKMLYNELNREVFRLKNELSKIPNWVKYIFK